MQALFRMLSALLESTGGLWYFIYRQLDAAFREFDNRRLDIAEHLHLIPPARFRTGGQSALPEYGYSAGVMAAYVEEHLRAQDPQVLDLGCGTGKMVSAIWPFLGSGGRYTGLDISAKAIEFDQKWYPAEKCAFIHAPLRNARYSPVGELVDTYSIPLADKSIDLITAFSLFTHLNQPDSTHYFNEIVRLLKPTGVAILTFFYIDTQDEDIHEGRYEFSQQLQGQTDWRYPKWVKVPEQAIGVTRHGVERLMDGRLELVKLYKGWWRKAPAAFLQDTLVFRPK